MRDSDDKEEVTDPEKLKLGREARARVHIPRLKVCEHGARVTRTVSGRVSSAAVMRLHAVMQMQRDSRLKWQDGDEQQSSCQVLASRLRFELWHGHGDSSFRDVKIS